MPKILTRADLFPYQNKAVEYVKQNNFAALFLDMGLGKSVSVLTAYLDLLESFDARHALIVAPLRVARKVFTDEIASWSHLNGLTTAKIIGTPQQRWDAMCTRADIHLTNREQIPWIEAQFIEAKGSDKFKQIRRWPWDTIILDESQSFKSPDSTRFKSMRRIRRLQEVLRLVEMTGTPSPNGYMDLWSQLFLLDKGQRLGYTIEAYRDRWFDPPDFDNYGYRIKPGAAAEIQALIADIVLTMRGEDYLDAPNVTYTNVMVDLPNPAMQKYQRMKRQYLAELGDNTVTAVNAGACCGKLLQMANGAVYYDTAGNWIELHKEKLAALIEVLDGASGPVLIAYGYKHDTARIADMLGRYCDSNNKTYRVLDTEQDEDDWNAGKIDFLLLHPASAGHGLNLQHSGSRTIVWFGLTSNLEFYQQLNARLIGGHRAGSRPTTIHRILAEDTYDLEMSALLDRKEYTQDDLKLSLVRLATEARAVHTS